MPTYSGNDFSDNLYSNIVGVQGTLTSGNWVSQGGYTHVASYTTLPNSVELTIPPGTVIKLTHNIVVEQNATLRAEGTAESPIYFTSIEDDSVGGDTNGDEGATLPTKGDWSKIEVESSTADSPHGTLIFDHVVVRYGGPCDHGDYCAMVDVGGAAQIRNSVIENSEGVGVRVYRGSTLNPTVIIENTTFRNNNRRAIYVEGP